MSNDSFDPMTYEVHNYRDDHYFTGSPTQMWPGNIALTSMVDELKRDTVTLSAQLRQLRDEVRSVQNDEWVSDEGIAEPSEKERDAFERGTRYQQTVIANWIRDNPHIIYGSAIAKDIDSGNYPNGVAQ